MPSVVVHPGQFRRPDPEDATIEDDVAEEIVDGLANYRGPVVVGWEQVIEESREPEKGFSVVVHEFAHQLDFQDQYTDGTPPLPTKADEERWAKVMSAAFATHQAELERGEETFFSDQAGDSETEFFADAAEAFFCAPASLIEEEPDVYAILANFFGVDPVAWFSA